MHRAGYVLGCVAIRGVVSHRGCGAGPGPVGGLVAFLPLPVTPAVVFCFVVVSVVVCNGLAVHAEEPPPFWWGRLLCGSSMVVEWSYEGRPRGVCCPSMPGKARSIFGRA